MNMDVDMTSYGERKNSSNDHNQATCSENKATNDHAKKGKEKKKK